MRLIFGQEFDQKTKFAQRQSEEYIEKHVESATMDDEEARAKEGCDVDRGKRHFIERKPLICPCKQVHVYVSRDASKIEAGELGFYSKDSFTNVDKAI